LIQCLHALTYDHGHGITSSPLEHPGPTLDGACVGFAFEVFRQNPSSEFGRLQVPEEARHTIRSSLNRIQPPEILLKVTDVFRDVIELMDIDPSLNASPDRIGFIKGKVMACLALRRI